MNIQNVQIHEEEISIHDTHSQYLMFNEYRSAVMIEDKSRENPHGVYFETTDKENWGFGRLLWLKSEEDQQEVFQAFSDYSKRGKAVA